MAREAGGIGPQTSNHIVTVLKAFGAWLLKTRRVGENPFQFLTRVNTKVDVRHVRRSLSTAEFELLLTAARCGQPYRKLTGQQRYTLYAVAANTGLRASELASLTPASFNLATEPPTLRVEACYSKHRKEDTLPVHPTLAAMLRVWLSSMASDELLWPGKWAANNHAGGMIRRDLESARRQWIADAPTSTERQQREASEFLRYKTAEGKADFHSLRHRFVTALAKARVHPSEAKKLARHSTIQLTMDRYTHIELEESAVALSKLQTGELVTPSMAPGLAPRRGYRTVQGGTNVQPDGQAASEKDSGAACETTGKQRDFEQDEIQTTEREGFEATNSTFELR